MGDRISAMRRTSATRRTSVTRRTAAALRGLLAGSLALLAAALPGSAQAREQAPRAGRERPSARAHAAASYTLLSRPHASFVWFPELPHPNEPVLLASVSTDPISPLVAYAWDLGAGGGFEAGGPARQTSFSTFAPQLVRLRVTNGQGVSDTAAETITMSVPPPGVLQPFPIVRIVAIVKPSGANVKLLAVKAGAGARSTLTCRGRRCPARAASRMVPVSRRGSQWVTFPSFQRFLPAGTVLEMRVTKPGKIGAYTRLAIRRHRLPSRVDRCLDTQGKSPIACPSS